MFFGIFASVYYVYYVGLTIAAKFTITIVLIVYLLYIFNKLIKQFMLIPVINRQIMKMLLFLTLMNYS